MNISELNVLDADSFAEMMLRVCGSSEWVSRMARGRPYSSMSQLKSLALSNWRGLDEDSWKEAFTHHPKIGDPESLQKRFASIAHWAENEQAGVKEADEVVMNQLREYNAKYEDRFGFIFIVCTTSLSAEGLLARLKERYGHTLADEIKNAVEENAKIISLRLAKL
jgi:2-oxo-4-hydroxy-4-carboxy-5-ureidoimidazoline decarboxylase